jgi:hypothetical protein
VRCVHDGPQLDNDVHQSPQTPQNVLRACARSSVLWGLKLALWGVKHAPAVIALMRVRYPNVMKKG